MNKNQLRAIMAREINAINSTLAAHGVDAGTLPKLAMPTPSYIAYGLKLGKGERVARVLALHRELAITLSNLRRTRTLVRFQSLPLAIETPHPAPTPLSWNSSPRPSPGTMTLGLSFGYRGAQVETLDLAETPHALVAGTTGSGKSNLLTVGLAGLLLATAPGQLQIMLVDLKNEDLVPFERAPHVRAFARTSDQAADVVAWLAGEKDRRISTGDRTPRLLLVVDELAELAGDKPTMERLGSLLSVGRSLGLNVIAATQHPLAAVVGSIAKANFPARLVGQVTDSNAARVATGRSDTGAEYLPGAGAFLRIHGADVRRFQSYFLPREEVAGLVAAIGREHGAQAVQRVPLHGEREGQDEQEQDGVGELVEQARPVFEEYYDPETCELRRGGLSAIIRAIFGPTASTGGHYRAVALRVVEALKNTTTTTWEPRPTSGRVALAAGSSSNRNGGEPC